MTQPSAWATLLRAPNAGPMTLDGTNTWVLRARDQPVTLVIDPGPDDATHLDAVAAAALAGGATVAGIVITHRHADHLDGLPGLCARTGATRLTPVDGDVLTVGDLTVHVIATPGHTDDSLCLLVEAPPASSLLLCGDTVLGRGTSVIAWPDGNLRQYLHSLERLERLVRERDIAQLLPGHGPVLDNPATVLAYYRRHRDARIEQVRAARAAGADTPDAVVAAVYPEIDPAAAPVLHNAALRTVRATLDYLDGRPASPRPDR